MNKEVSWNVRPKDNDTDNQIIKNSLFVDNENGSFIVYETLVKKDNSFVTNVIYDSSKSSVRNVNPTPQDNSVGKKTITTSQGFTLANLSQFANNVFWSSGTFTVATELTNSNIMIASVTDFPTLEKYQLDQTQVLGLAYDNENNVLGLIDVAFDSSGIFIKTTVSGETFTVPVGGYIKFQASLILSD